jgi:hypothetical protein
LQGYFFEPESPVENYDDLWEVWSQGEGHLDHVQASLEFTGSQAVVVQDADLQDLNPMLHSMANVLGFDLQSDRLQGYFFEPESPVENYDDLWEVWSQNCTVTTMSRPAWNSRVVRP